MDPITIDPITSRDIHPAVKNVQRLNGFQVTESVCRKMPSLLEGAVGPRSPGHQRAGAGVFFVDVDPPP